MKAYKCDGCGQFKSGENRFTLQDAFGRGISRHEEHHACSLGCLVLLVNRIAESDEARPALAAMATR